MPQEKTNTRNQDPYRGTGQKQNKITKFLLNIAKRMFIKCFHEKRITNFHEFFNGIVVQTCQKSTDS